MTTTIDTLEPRHVWTHFDAIRKVPRPSRHEERIREHLLAWARERNFETRVDKVGNVVICVPGSKGREKAPVLVLQAHMDMVCEKNADVSFDFMQDPIQLRIDGEWLTAQGTTLGADNGVGLASALAVADDPAVVHGPLEILVTMDEETGLTGAAQLDASIVTGRQLINLDTEELGAIYIGCSGGGNSTLSVPVTQEKAPAGAQFAEVVISGLKGGHSGMEIHLHRGNAVSALARILQAAGRAAPVHVARIAGGNAHNAIPREARALCAVPADKFSAFRDAVTAEGKRIADELGAADPEMTVAVTKSSESVPVMDAASTRRVVSTLVLIPHGVEEMSVAVPGLVETSSNLASVVTREKAVDALVSVRSPIRSAMDGLRGRLHALAALTGGSIEEGEPYPGWNPDLDSKLLAVTRKVHERALGIAPELKAVHAGLECGVIGEKLPGIDMVSIGPWIEAPHSPAERINIPSVATYWKLLVAVVDEVSR
ncbi:MAG TPA: aminoacyl-histidine dipeptidase [Candidatus Krumholzibacteria bacterium]|nr:aminoacyl-histidine dipeptidase [Candidatus Krumholzibacteria bacterium]